MSAPSILRSSFPPRSLSSARAALLLDPTLVAPVHGSTAKHRNNSGGGGGGGGRPSDSDSLGSDSDKTSSARNRSAPRQDVLIPPSAFYAKWQRGFYGEACGRDDISDMADTPLGRHRGLLNGEGLDGEGEEIRVLRDTHPLVCEDKDGSSQSSCENWIDDKEETKMDNGENVCAFRGTDSLDCEVKDGSNTAEDEATKMYKGDKVCALGDIDSLECRGKDGSSEKISERCRKDEEDTKLYKGGAFNTFGGNNRLLDSNEAHGKCEKIDQASHRMIEMETKICEGGILRSLEELLSRMEASPNAYEPLIAATCLRLAELCDSADEDPAKILSYGERALKVFKSSEISWEHASCLYVNGYAHFKMGNFEAAVQNLEQSLQTMKKSDTVSAGEVEKWTLGHAVEALLAQSMMSLGRYQEAFPHFLQAIAIHEEFLEPGNPNLGASYLQAAEAFKEAKDPEEAISFCFKALENYSNYYGSDSSQVASVRRLMSMVYFDLREFEDALCEYEIVRPILVRLERFDEVAAMDLASVESLFQLGKYEEAIRRLKGVVKDAKETSLCHGNAFIMLARCFAMLKRGNSVIKYCEKALASLEQQSCSFDLGTSLVNLALVHQRQQDYDQAISVYKKALGILNQCSGRHAASAGADVEGQIGFLLLQIEKIDEALPFLENSVSRKKSIHGSVSEELLDVYNHLGVAYSEIGNLDQSLEQFEAARKVVSQNSLEVDALTISVHSNLANMYSLFGRFDEAVECQKIVVDWIQNNKNVEAMVSLEEAEEILKEYIQEAQIRVGKDDSKPPK